MPLGIDNDGIAAGIIERGGAALSATIQQTGQKIQASLLQQQAFRQARELGSALTQIDPASDKWPQQAAFLTSQFPLAVASGLAKPIIEPMAKAFAGFQAAKVADIRVQGQKDVAGMRAGNSPVYVGGSTTGASGGLSDNPENPIIDVRPGQSASMLGAFGPAGMVANVAANETSDQNDSSLLPPLPVDAATGMRRRASRPLQSYIEDASKVFNDAIAAKQAPPFTRSQISTIAARQKAADDKEISALNAAPKVKVTLSGPDGALYRELADGTFLYPDGTKHAEAPQGLTRVAGANEERRLNLAEKTATQRQARNEHTDIVKSAQAEYNDAAKTFATENTLLHKLEAAADAASKKGVDPEALASNQAAIKEQQVRAQEAKDRQAKALKAYQDTLKSLPILTPEEAKALPSGTKFKGTDGNVYTRQ